LKRIGWLLSLAAVLVIWAGCVPISQNVPVYAPGQVEDRGRSPLDVCQPHSLPHRLILATAGVPSPMTNAGSAQVNDQAGFDYWWGQVNAQLDPGVAVNSKGEPLIDWTNQTAYFAVMPVNNACQKVWPYGDEMNTDCYTISVLMYIDSAGPPCDPQPLTQVPVFIYIYPTTNLPLSFKAITPTPMPSPTGTPTATVTATPTVTPTPAPSPIRKHRRRHAQQPV
jgi:hypothetical protein